MKLFSKTLSFLLFILFITNNLNAQEQIGMRGERYSGLWGLSLNPTNTALSPLKWDVNLVDLSVFGRNNYAFLRNTSIPNVLRNPTKLVSIYDTLSDRTIPRNSIVQDFYMNNRSINGAFEMEAMGLAASFRIGEHHQFGFFTKVRAQASAYHITNKLHFKTLNDLPRFEDVKITAPTGGSGMAWTELGFNYAWRSVEEGEYNVAYGISPRILLGMEAAYVNVNKDFTWQKSNGDTLAFNNGNWDYAVTTSSVDNVLQKKIPKPSINGKGFGVDFGFSIAKPDEDGELAEDYLWKFGAALNDLGAIDFDKNTEKHHVEFKGTKFATMHDVMDETSLTNTLQKVSKTFMGDSSASYVTHSFQMGLPTALSLQFDKKIMNDVYVEASMIQRISMASNHLKKANSLAIVPRFEKKWCSFAMPIHLTDWRNLRVGAAARIGGFAFGSDHLGALVKTKHLSGADFYFGLKINTFSLKLGNRLGFLSKSRRISCFQF
jgi:hypothetical protein